VDIRRSGLFESDALQVGLFEARPSSDACGDVERQGANAIVLPLTGLFAKHEAPGRHVMGTPATPSISRRRRPTGSAFPAASGIARSRCDLARR